MFWELFYDTLLCREEKRGILPSILYFSIVAYIVILMFDWEAKIFSSFFVPEVDERGIDMEILMHRVEQLQRGIVLLCP